MEDRVPKGSCLLLKRGVYGLKEAGRMWHIAFREALTALGFRICVADPCLYILDRPEGYITISTWVDDGAVAYSSKPLYDAIIGRLAQKFPISAAGDLSWLLGMAVRQGEGYIELDQSKYIGDVLQRFASHGLLTASIAQIHTPYIERNQALSYTATVRRLSVRRPQ